MDSLINLYRIGNGPSSSHTMGPSFAVLDVKSKYPQATSWIAVLYGSLAQTGKGHLTDKAIEESFSPMPVSIQWQPDQLLPDHPNGMSFLPLDQNGNSLANPEIYYSIGGGTIMRPNQKIPLLHHIYPFQSMKEILQWSTENKLPLWSLVDKIESKEIWPYLDRVWKTMNNCIDLGLTTEGVLAGGLQVPRRARTWYLKAKRSSASVQKSALISAYAMAVGEQNASAQTVVTAPTCGAAGVIPATLRFLKEEYNISDDEIIHALATAGLIGNLVKFNASISGAEAGCQAEIGTACSMAAAAAAQLLGGTVNEIEYAAEMGLEHNLGLTCDPISGLVQIPCIERNAFAASRAIAAAEFSIISDGSHLISFDDVVETLKQTGMDMHKKYRETAEGGLAKICKCSKGIC